MTAYHSSLSLSCSLQGICQSLLSCSLLLFPSYLFIIMHKYIDSQRRLLVSAKVQPETASSPLRLSPPPLHLVHLMAGRGGARGVAAARSFMPHCAILFAVCATKQIAVIHFARRISCCCCFSLLAACCSLHAA